MRALIAALLVTLGGSGMAVAENFNPIKQSLKRIFPGQTAEQISTSPIDGLYEVVIGGEVIYSTADGKFFMQGNLYNVEAGKNLTEARRAGIRSKVLGTLKESDLIVFTPKKTKHTITVFTDIDCGYCRKLHSEIQTYNDKGIAVRYAAYPRSGIGSRSYHKAVAVWCAADRKAAMTKAKAGGKLEEKKCDNPVASQYKLGGRLGIQGTPAIFLSDGTMLPGYVPADRLASMLETETAKR